METTFDYLRQFGPLLAERILETYPPLQSTKDPVDPSLQTLLRKPLPAQAVAITGTAKYLQKEKAARIVAECGAGKTYMALGAIHALSGGQPTTTLVMCPSHITHKWAREVLLTVPRARTFLIEDMRNGGDPAKPHGVCEVKLNKGKIIYEGKRLSLAEMRRVSRKEWRMRFTGPTFFITGKDKGKLSYFWEHVYLKAKSGPNLGGVVNPDSGMSILDSEMEKLTALDFGDKQKVSEMLTAPRGGTTRFSALWQADRTRIQRMAPIEYIGRYMAGWFDFAIADELHQLAGDTAQGNALGVLGRAAERLIALTGTLMGGYADDLFNIFWRMEPRVMVREGFAYGGASGLWRPSAKCCDPASGDAPSRWTSHARSSTAVNGRLCRIAGAFAVGWLLGRGSSRECGRKRRSLDRMVDRTLPSPDVLSGRGNENLEVRWPHVPAASLVVARR